MPCVQKERLGSSYCITCGGTFLPSFIRFMRWSVGEVTLRTKPTRESRCERSVTVRCSCCCPIATSPSDGFIDRCSCCCCCCCWRRSRSCHCWNCAHSLALTPFDAALVGAFGRRLPAMFGLRNGEEDPPKPSAPRIPPPRRPSSCRRALFGAPPSHLLVLVRVLVVVLRVVVVLLFAHGSDRQADRQASETSTETAGY